MRYSLQLVQTLLTLSTYSGVTQCDVVRYSFEKPEPLKIKYEQFRDKVLNSKGSNVHTATVTHMNFLAGNVTVAEGCESV